MWSTLKRSSGAKLGHDKRAIPAFDTVLFHSNLCTLRRKFLSDVPTDKIVLSCGPKISKGPLKTRYWWLKNKEGKFYFRFVERRLLAAINCTGSAEGALVPVLLRITHWPKSGLPVSPPGLFPPCWKSWHPLAHMIWDNFAIFGTNCAILMTYICTDPHTCHGFSRGCCHIAWSKGQVTRFSCWFLTAMAGNKTGAKNQSAYI